ncbi:hypothetical protein E3P86_03819 [Wallemia ichthyophaga]|uniref:RBR-type E3 ubiquitin transferase n=1 Tax=Wallemia ichthyophaga TaxID=245174 RepID=A0A4T0IG15_WALIC|nr:hypothetical protein E3P86_03819 [Wallemia ichthyophaga]
MSDDSDNYMDAASFEGSDIVEDYQSSNPSEAFSDDDVEIEDNEAFIVNEPVKPKKSKFDVDYKVYDINDIISNQQSETEQVCSIFGLQRQDATILLRHFGWNREKLIERYSEDPERILKQVGLAPGTSASAQSDSRASSPVRLKRVKGFTCEICFTGSEDTSTQTLALACGHRFCSDCWKMHCEEKISGQGESRKIECMQGDCQTVMSEQVISQVVPEYIFQRYQTLANKTYVEDNRRGLRFCPGPDCGNVIECQVRGSDLESLIPIVVCKCGQASCFGCSFSGDHRPALCGVTKLWVKKCEDDSETANWISANTKECPRCHSTIEKNGGCNHMTCRKCRHEWCWICMGDWSAHGTSYYNCNRFEDKSGKDARDGQQKSRVSLERYLHYYNRFSNHEQSARLDQELYAKTERKMDEMQRSTSLTWIEVQFVKKAVETVTKCRMTLKWTYAMAYYLDRNSMTELFEDNQADLEKAVENLSELLEKPLDVETIPELRSQMQNATNYVKIAALSLISAAVSAAAINSRQLGDMNGSISSAINAFNGGNQPKQQDTTQQLKDTNSSFDKSDMVTASSSGDEKATPDDPNNIDWKNIHQIAHAQFTDNIKGNVKIKGNWKEPTVVEIDINEGLEEHKRYNYSVNVQRIDDGDCNSAGDILNPVGIPENVVCDEKKPEYCKEGDLSGKHGQLKMHSHGSCKEEFRDEYLRFFPQPFSLLGRSVVITDESNTRIACANIISMIDGTQKEKGSFEGTGKTSTYQDDYREPTKTGEGKAQVTPFQDGKTVDSNAVPTKSNPAIKESPSVDPSVAVLEENNSSGALSSSNLPYRFFGLTIVSAMFGAIIL